MPELDAEEAEKSEEQMMSQQLEYTPEEVALL
jgi:hypothetical protein